MRTCGEHPDARFGPPVPGFDCDAAAAGAARHNLLATVEVIPPAREWESSDDESVPSEECADSSPPWSPRSYYPTSDEASNASDDAEPIAKRLRPTFLGDFYSEHPAGRTNESDEEEYAFSD